MPIKKKTTVKEDILSTTIAQLHTALTGLKEQLGEKKFEKRTKKAAKLLIEGIKKEPVKKKESPEKKAKPATKKAEKALSAV